MEKQIQIKDGRAFLFAELGSEVEVKDKLLGGTFEVNWRDKRLSTSKQRKFFHVLCSNVAKERGEHVEWYIAFFKSLYSVIYNKQISLSDSSDTTVKEANDLILIVIEHILENNIGLDTTLITHDDVKRVTYVCMMNRKCIICGQHARVHHVDAIGMGGDRTQVSHIGRRALPLCDIHHEEIHKTGLEKFKEKYHVEEIVITREIVEKLKIRGIEIKED